MSELETASPPIRLSPEAPVLPVIHSESELHQAITHLKSGIGSIAIDAERASGYKYFQRAYLIQLFRTGSPIALIDPINLDLTPLADLLNQTPWILHAATQDLPCLNELGLYPPELFDTELAAKLAGLPKVGLASLTENLLEISLAKEHSAVNWSIRPLESDWLNYAALDVELLPALKIELESLLAKQNRTQWAEQEFANLKNFKPNPPRSEQWRRTSGMHELPSRRQKAVVKELWQVRDTLARELDLAPGRLINDRALIAIAKISDKSVTHDQIRKLIRGPALDYLSIWISAINTAKELPDSSLPKAAKREDSIPNPKSWEELNSDAFDRWNKYRPATNALASDLSLSPEVLISPDALRRFCWEGQIGLTQEEINQRLLSLGVRDWAASIISSKFAEINL